MSNIESAGVSIHALLSSKSLAPALRDRIVSADKVCQRRTKPYPLNHPNPLAHSRTLPGAPQDGNGELSVDEVLAVMRSEIDMARDRRMLRRVAAVLVAGLVLSVAAVAGLTFAVVALSKDTASSGGALVDKVTGVPLRTAGGFLAITTSLEADADVLALWDVAAPPSRYGFDGTTLVYDSSVNASAVAFACELIAEGRDRIIASDDANGAAPVSVIHSAACSTGGAGAEGVIVHEGIEYILRCPVDVGTPAAKCHLFTEINPSNTTGAGAGGARRRSLLGVDAMRAPVHVVAGASEMRCDVKGECQVTSRPGHGRKLRLDVANVPCESPTSCASPRLPHLLPVSCHFPH